MAKLGRLKCLGISDFWQAALYCPFEYKDYTQVFEVFDSRFLLQDGHGVFSGRIKYPPETSWKNGKPRTKFVIHDGNETIMFTLFGDTRELVKANPPGERLVVEGIINKDGGRIYLNNASVVDKELIGTIAPIYKGIAGKVRPDNVRKLIAEHLDDAVDEATNKLRELLNKHIPPQHVRSFVGCKDKTLKEVLLCLHKPKTLTDGYQALEVVTRIAHLSAADGLLNRAAINRSEAVRPLVGMDPTELAKGIPFKLTDEQFEQVMVAVSDMYHGIKSSFLLTGDVGTGKTAVYGLVSAYVASAGERVAIMLPNQNLAVQVYEELNEYFGGLGVGLMTGSHKCDIQHKRIIVGTTALLFQDIGRMGLVVCDEQQKMAIGQREKLLSENTHLLEVSATPIPRTMAFALYGAVKLLQLRHCHVEKHIETKVYFKEDRLVLMEGVRKTISEGNKVLIVCARCESDEDNPDANIISAEEMYEGMCKHFPGEVVIAHSKMDQQESKASIAKIKQDKASILVSTTVAEVGLTIPRLTRTIIVNAERYGLTSLHQLRGRTSRQGGRGDCCLYLPNPKISDSTMERMKVMVDCRDGFEIARRDMALRGVGDIGKDGDAQHGEYTTLIKGIKGSLADIESIIEEIESLKEQAYEKAS